MKFIGFLLCLVPCFAHIWASFDSEITSFAHEVGDASVVQNVTFALVRHENRNVINGSLVFVKNVDDCRLELGVRLLRQVGPDIVLLDSIVSLCELLKRQNMPASNLVRIILAKFRKTKGYFPEKCPFELQRPVTVENFYVDTDMFPAYVPDVSYTAKFHLHLHDKFLIKNFVNGTIAKRGKVAVLG